MRPCEGSRFQRWHSPGLENCGGFEGFGGCGFRWVPRFGNAAVSKVLEFQELIGFDGFWRLQSKFVNKGPNLTGLHLPMVVIKISQASKIETTGWTFLSLSALFAEYPGPIKTKCAHVVKNYVFSIKPAPANSGSVALKAYNTTLPEIHV